MILTLLDNFTVSLLSLRQACRAVSQQTQSRCFHHSPLSYAATKAAMSRLDDAPLPYDRLQKNYDVVKKRWEMGLSVFVFLYGRRGDSCGHLAIM